MHTISDMSNICCSLGTGGALMHRSNAGSVMHVRYDLFTR